MDVWKEKLEYSKDPLFKTLRQIILAIADKYTPKYVNNLRFELHLDKSKENVIINMIQFNI